MKRAVSGSTPAGAYSPGVVASGTFVYVSGQGPLRDGEPVTGTIQEETEVVLENLASVLSEAGASLADVVRVGVFLADLDDFAAMNEVYAEFLAAHVPSGALPARTTVFVDLPHEVMLVEIDALAVTS
jgi:2-iminobutanoate/2-iminopropanoate deaminase